VVFGHSAGCQTLERAMHRPVEKLDQDQEPEDPRCNKNNRRNVLGSKPIFPPAI
jgi:hypothetical protein